MTQPFLNIIIASATVFVGVGALASLATKLYSDFQASQRYAKHTSEWRHQAERLEKIGLTDGPKYISPTSPSDVARNQVIFRLNEVKLLNHEVKTSAKTAKISSNLLTVGQYVVGGVLASSFVQEALTPKLVGALGVLVLVASLVKQQFHPDLTAADSGRKALQFKALIRTSEDQLVTLDAKIAAGENHTDALITLLNRITETLNEIETSLTTDAKNQ